MRSIDDRNRNNAGSKTGPDEILSSKGTLEHAELSPYQEPEMPHANTVSIEFINNLKRNYDALEREFLFESNVEHTEQQENTTKKPFFTQALSPFTFQDISFIRFLLSVVILS